MDDYALQVRVSCFKSHVSRPDLLTREGDRAWLGSFILISLYNNVESASHCAYIVQLHKSR
jgi:hypothetical protein